MIVGFLNFNKAKRQTVHKQSDVRAELILPVLTGKLGCKMECIILYVVKVNQFYRRYGFETVIKTTTKIIIIQFLANVFQYLNKFPFVSRIQLFELLFENRQ